MNVTKLKNTETVNDLQSVINRKLSNLPTPSNDIEGALASFRDTFHSTALEVLGLTTRNHQDWLDENDAVALVLLEEKRRLLRAHQSDPFCLAEQAVFINLRSQIQTKLRCKARLCPCADTVQLDVLYYADRCIQRLRRWRQDQT